MLNVLFSERAEENTIGSILIASEQFREVSGIIETQDFYVERNRHVFDAIKKVSEAGLPVDVTTVCDRLEKNGLLETIGGLSRLTGLIANTPKPFNAVGYAEIVREKSTRRAMKDAANGIVKLAHDETMPIDECLSKLTDQTGAVFDRSSTNGDFITMREAVERHFDHKEAESKGEVKKVPSGWKGFNKIINGGLQNHQFVIVGGRPGHGKTSFMHNYSISVAKNKSIEGVIPVFSIEMDDIEIVDRAVAFEGVNTQHISSGRLSDSEYPIYSHFLDFAPDLPILIDDKTSTIPRMRAKLAKLASREKIAMIVVDYIQLMSGHGDNRNLEISYISRNLKLFTKEFGCPVVVGSQLSREVERRADKRPVLSDLRDSGSLEQDADIVVFVYRPELYYDDPQFSNMAQFIVAKHRGGPLGSVEMVYRKQFTRFDEVERKVM